jgi:hypothetical protein
MKKTVFLGLAAMATLITACSSDDVVDIKAPGTAIGFSSFIDKATRAELTTDNIEAFNVYGYTKTTGDNPTDQTIFYNEKVSKSNGSWTYTNTQYWVVDQPYDFHAIASSNVEWEAETTKSSGKLTFTFGGGTDDLLYDYVGVAKAAADGNGDFGVVKFTFNHLLSKVQFKFTNALTATNVQLEVTDVKIKEYPYSGGEITLGTSDDNGRNSSNASNWTLTDVSGDKSDLAFAFPSGTTYATKNNSNTTDPLFLMPAKKAYDLTFTLTLHAYTAEKDNTGIPYTRTETVTLPEVEMLPGYSYLFSASITEENLNPGNSSTDKIKPITFSVDKVEGWTSTDEKALQTTVE